MSNAYPIEAWGLIRFADGTELHCDGETFTIGGKGIIYAVGSTDFVDLLTNSGDIASINADETEDETNLLVKMSNDFQHIFETADEVNTWIQTTNLYEDSDEN